MPTCSELLSRRLLQPDPRKAVLAVAAELRGLLDLDRAVVLALPLFVMRAVDDHAVVSRSAWKASRLAAELSPERMTGMDALDHLGVALPEADPDVERGVEARSGTFAHVRVEGAQVAQVGHLVGGVDEDRALPAGLDLIAVMILARARRARCPCPRSSHRPGRARRSRKPPRSPRASCRCPRPRRGGTSRRGSPRRRGPPRRATGRAAIGWLM